MAAPILVLVHSSSVGPSTWAAVETELGSDHDVVVPSMLGFAEHGPPYAPAYLDRATAALASLPADRAVILIAHSNAGLFLPALAASLAPRAVALVFADASIPPVDAPGIEVAPPSFLDELHSMAVEGVLPRWSAWWPEEATAALYPDAATRDRVAAEEPQLPLSFYEEMVTVPTGWASLPCGYLRLSEGYEFEAASAARLGWPVRRLSGEHLHMLVNPVAVGEAIRDLATALTPSIGPREA